MRTARWAVGLWVALASVTPALAQAPRTDAIWARSTAGAAITMDGQLNEPAWAAAETWKVRYRYDNGIPGSGWKDEAGFIPNGSTSDSTNATLKFLVVSDTLYLGVIVPDKSIGGSGQFNRFDGLLMALKDRGNANFPKPPVEYLYSWWYPAQSGDVNPCKNDSAKGNPPIFKGQWAPNPVCDALGNVNTRTAEQMAAWNARTVVNGITNSDTTLDVGYTVEMRFDLGVMGYDVTRPQGDIVEWNLSIYDCDQFWKSSITAEFSDNRAWWQCPWGNVAEQDEVRIYARPDVTINSGPAPVIGPELRIPNNGTVALPTIDGQLTDGIWSQTPHFDIRWGDDPLRATYPGVGPWRSGQFQPNVQGGQAFVADGGDATVKYFYSGDWLYMGFDARDKYVQSYPVEDRWDGFTVSITNRTEVDPQDHNLQGKALSFIVSPSGTALAQKDLAPLVSSGNAQVALVLKPGTVIDTVGSQQDTGYTAELKVNLTALGYPTGLGDRTIFLGVTLHDGDSFNNPVTDSYATRTWFFREREEQCCPVWGYLDPALTLVGVGDLAAGPSRFATLGNHPNPFHLATTLEFTMERQGDVDLQVFDIEGRSVAKKFLGRFDRGVQSIPIQLPVARSGVYLYRLKVHDPAGGAALATLAGKMMVLR